MLKKLIYNSGKKLKLDAETFFSEPSSICHIAEPAYNCCWKIKSKITFIC